MISDRPQDERNLLAPSGPAEKGLQILGWQPPERALPSQEMRDTVHRERRVLQHRKVEMGIELTIAERFRFWVG